MEFSFKIKIQVIVYLRDLKRYSKFNKKINKKILNPSININKTKMIRNMLRVKHIADNNSVKNLLYLCQDMFFPRKMISLCLGVWREIKVQGQKQKEVILTQSYRLVFLEFPSKTIIESIFQIINQ